ncbi:MAG: cell division protein [Caulobacterales bacterium]
MILASIFKRRVRGFRVIDLTAFVVVLALAFTVYAFKTFAGREGANIVDVENQIGVEDKRVRLLRAEVATLESPDRMERLAGAIGLKPVGVDQDVTAEALPQVATAKRKLQPVEAPAPDAASNQAASNATDDAAALSPAADPEARR